MSDLAPAAHAAAILAWLDGLSAERIDADLADPLHPGFAHIAAIADVADSDDEATRSAGLGALFAGLVEPLNDGFSLAGRAAYARLFTHAVWRIAERTPTLSAALAGFGIGDEAALSARYAGSRRGDAFLPGSGSGAGVVDPGSVRKVLLLSRVTIGADVLLGSVAAQRARQRWPAAEIVWLGDGKLAGLFGGMPGVRVRHLAYARRGPLRERLASWLAVVEAVRDEAPDAVLAPDSRLDQLGVLPVITDPTRYLLWENTRADGAAPESLANQLDRHLARRLHLPPQPPAVPRVVFDAAAASASARLRAASGPRPLAAVKLDHGGNPAKALPRAGEVAVLRALRERGWRVLIDRGFGADELANSDALIGELGWTAVDIDDSGKGLGRNVADLTADALAGADVIRFHGSIAGWAGGLACCGLAISYDSVGHHLAAALGVPVVVAFTGFADPAFPIAWQPRGRAPVTVVAIATTAKADPAQWQRVIKAIPAAS